MVLEPIFQQIPCFFTERRAHALHLHRIAHEYTHCAVCRTCGASTSTPSTKASRLIQCETSSAGRASPQARPTRRKKERAARTPATSCCSHAREEKATRKRTLPCLRRERQARHAANPRRRCRAKAQGKAH